MILDKAYTLFKNKGEKSPIQIALTVINFPFPINFMKNSACETIVCLFNCKTLKPHVCANTCYGTLFTNLVICLSDVEALI